MACMSLEIILFRMAGWPDGWLAYSDNNATQPGLSLATNVNKCYQMLLGKNELVIS